MQSTKHCSDFRDNKFRPFKRNRILNLFWIQCLKHGVIIFEMRKYKLIFVSLFPFFLFIFPLFRFLTIFLARIMNIFTLPDLMKFIYDLPCQYQKAVVFVILSWIRNMQESRIRNIIESYSTQITIIVTNNQCVILRN